MIVLWLVGENAVEMWQQLMGPENCSVARKSAPSSLRALYGDAEDEVKNAVYGSKSDDDVGHELRFFFPNSKQLNMAMPFTIHFSCPTTFSLSAILEPISINTDGGINNYLCNVIYQPLTHALYEMTKVKPADPLEWLANYMLRHNNNKPVIHEMNPQAIKNLMEIRDEEEREKNHKRIDDFAPAKCGCYLSKSSSHASSLASCCCKKY